MEVRLVYFDGCPNWRTAADRLHGVLNWMGCRDVPVTWVRVETEAAARAAGFAGSPTILIDGQDLFPPSTAWPGGLACRLYRTSTGLAGAPTVDDIAAALSEKV